MKNNLIIAAAVAAALGSSGAQAFTSINPQCIQAILYKVPCTALTYNGTFVAKLQAYGAAPSMPWQGNTTATVDAQFPVVINWEFQSETSPALNQQMTKFSDLDLSRFSHVYWLASKGQLTTLLHYAALKLTAPNLIRFKAAFGAAAMDLAVNSSAPATVRAQYFALPSPKAIPASHAAHVLSGKIGTATMTGASGGLPAPTNDMTLREIYDEFLFTNAETELGAFAKMAVYASGELGKAFTIGWQVGGHFYGFASTINPDYGYDLVTQYGELLTDFPGTITSESASGSGTVDWPNVIQWDSGGPGEANKDVTDWNLLKDMVIP